jgi:hypothetical protein
MACRNVQSFDSFHSLPVLVIPVLVIPVLVIPVPVIVIFVPTGPLMALLLLAPLLLLVPRVLLVSPLLVGATAQQLCKMALGLDDGAADFFALFVARSSAFNPYLHIPQLL